MDDVRNYLLDRAKHVGWQKEWIVWRAIELMIFDKANDHNSEHADRIKAAEEKFGPRRKARRTSRGFLRWSPDMRYDGLKEIYIFREAAAVRPRLSVNDVLWEETHGEHKVTDPQYWEFERAFLDELAKWRMSLKKRRGGIKALEAEYGRALKLREKERQERESELRSISSR